MVTTPTDVEGTSPVNATGIARWARLGSLALIVAAVGGPILMLVASLLWGLDVSEDAPFFLVTAALAVGGAVLLRQRRTALRIVGVVLALLTGAALFWTAFGLFAPDSVFDFVPGVAVIPGALVGLVAGIAAIRAQRRGDLLPAAGGGERRGIAIVLGVVGVAAVASTILTLAGKESVGDDVAVDATVELSDFEFDQDAYQLAPGATVLVRNDDPFLHTFTVEDLDLDVQFGPGDEQIVTIPRDAAAGTYVLYCEPHTGEPDDPADDDMAAELEIL